MSDSIDKLLHMAMAGPFADCSLNEPLTEDSQAEWNRIFASLKPKETLLVAMTSIMGRHPKMDGKFHPWKVGRRSHSKRSGMTSVTLLPMEGKPKKGARLHRISLYTFKDGDVNAGWGDMAVMLKGLKRAPKTEGVDDHLTPEERMLLGLDRGASSGPWFGDDAPTGPRPLMEGETSHYFPQPMTLAEHRSDDHPIVEEALDCEMIQSVSFSAGPGDPREPEYEGVPFKLEEDEELVEAAGPRKGERYTVKGIDGVISGPWEVWMDSSSPKQNILMTRLGSKGKKKGKALSIYVPSNQFGISLKQWQQFTKSGHIKPLREDELAELAEAVTKVTYLGKKDQVSYKDALAEIDKTWKHQGNWNMPAIQFIRRTAKQEHHAAIAFEAGQLLQVIKHSPLGIQKQKAMYDRLRKAVSKHKEESAEDRANLAEMEAGDIDGAMKEIRKKVIKGAKPTRARRLAGCLRALRTGGITVSGQSQTDLNPVPKVERNKEDQPKDDTPGEVDESLDETTGPPDADDPKARQFGMPSPNWQTKRPPRAKRGRRKKKYEDTEDVMNLSDAIRRFRGEDEEPAPKPEPKPEPQAESHARGATPEYGESFNELRGKGMALDDFGSFGDASDVQFAEAMLTDDPTLTGMDRRLAQLEANIPVKGGKSKSRFRQPYKGPGKGVHGPASTPADPEAKAAATRSTAGVSGPGYTPDGREEVDVRTEQREPKSARDLDLFAEGMEYPDDLIKRDKRP